jgi:GNAT superfamily N-acetyltransferase
MPRVMGAELQVRSMTTADANDVADLATQLGYPSTAAQIANRVRDISARADDVLLVAELAGRVAGWIHVQGQHLLENDPYARIAGLVVDRSVRRRGVGRRLINAAEEWARAAGYPVIRVSTNSARTESRPFYESVGYTLLKTQYALHKNLG